MPEILATWPLAQQQRPQDFTSRSSTCSSTASTTMIAPQAANGASANAALEEQGHEYKTVRMGNHYFHYILHASLHKR